MLSASLKDEVAPVLQHQMHTAKTLCNELRQLLTRYAPALNEEGIREQIEWLEHWMEVYRLGLEAECNISQTGTTWLAELEERLKLASDEMHRLESEGGSPASQAHTARAEETLNAVQRIEADIERLLRCTDKAPENA